MELRRSRRAFPPFLSPHLLLLLLTTSLFACSSNADRELSVFATEGNQKVTLALYYETLCPYCSNFIVNYLPKLFDGGLLSIVDLKLIPYGNAKIRSNHTISCQHGPNECLLNTVEACAIDIWPDLETYFPFIYCIEALVHEGHYSQWESCFGKLGLDQKVITDCYSSGRGNELELKYAAETNSLQPPHKYVPWVVVDGLPLHDDYVDFVSFICKAYKGSNPPSACSKSSISITNEKSKNLIRSIWFAQTAKAASTIKSVASWLNWG